MMLSGWGRYPRLDCPVLSLREPEDALRFVARNGSLIARGNGRSYGDAALNQSSVVSTLRSDRILAFDPATREITCEAGLLLSDLLDFAVPRGLFPPVTPGTKYVTVGGMIAADVHGKNHHRAGTFGRHVVSLELLTADGTIRHCSRETEPALFAATCGGMGLTGIVLAATFRMIPIETAWIRSETLRAEDLDAAMDQCEASAGWTYTVAWIDCLARGARLGRSLVYRGEHARAEEVAGTPLAVPHRRAWRVPFDLPSFVLNRFAVRIFNEVYYQQGKPGTAIVDLDRYFYPLDAVLDWNRIYGPGGLVQYQCAIPLAASRAAVKSLLEKVSAAGSGSFLAVLKLFGSEGDGLLSFPMEGYTLTLDFPVTAGTLTLLLTLDAIVADHGGRIYLAKDARAGARFVRRSYPKLDAFSAVRGSVDPAGKFSSLLSQRLDL